jgi:aminocarboxymuconate-semialdehyde decarboxylase
VRLAENEKEGIDHQMLFPTQLSIPTYIEGELGAALARAYNNWVKKLVVGNEDRLWPVGVLPWGHPEALVDELRHCVRTLAFKAVHLTPYSHKHTIDNSVFEPLYAEAEKLNVPLMLHPAACSSAILIYASPSSNAVRNGCSTGCTAWTTIISG